MSQIRLKYKETPATSRGTKLFRAGFLLVLLLLIAYFVVSSSWFLKSVVVPRVGAALNSTLTVGDLELRPFAELTLTQVKLTPNGGDPLLEAKRLHARYSLLAIIRGNLLIEELTLDSPTITIVENARGTSNLDALAGKSAPRRPATASGPPPRLDIKAIALKNATFRHTRSSPNGDRVSLELANVNLAAKNIRNGGAGTLNLSAALAMEKVTTAPPAAASLQSLINADFTFGLLEDLKPSSVKGLASFSVGRATGEFAELAALVARLDCEMTPTTVQKFALKFTKATAALGEVRLSGPFDTGKTEGKLKVEVLAIDRQVLNLFGAARGIDFGTTTINGATDVTIAQAGRMVSLVGRLDVAKLQIVEGKQTSPTLDLGCSYDLTLDRTGQSLLLKAINFEGTQNQQPLLKTTLSAPLTIAFGDTINTADASLDFSLNGLNLADWHAFAPGLDLAGIVSAKGKLFSRDGGKRLSLEFDKNIRAFSARLGGSTIAAGDIRFSGTVNHTATDDTLLSSLVLTDLTLASAPGNPLQARLDIDAGVSNQVAELRQCSLKLTPTPRARNELALTGRIDLSDARAMTGKLNLAADALDLTGYYDLFAGKPATTNSTPAPTATPATPSSNAEPAPIGLPFKNFVVAAVIHQFYVREVDAADFKATLLLDGSHVLLQPFQLTLNSAPVSALADLDLSVPGYKYNLAFSADGVPVEPLANTFSPTYRGQAKGTLIAKIEAKGGGVTGRSLKTNLTARADLIFTNANIQLVGPKVQSVLTPIAMALNSQQLLQSPLDYLTASLRAGDGKIEVPAFVAQSPAFRADSAGSIPMADVLNDSPVNQPLELSLPRELAAKLGISNVPTNEAYAKLPTFVQLTGTLGDPKAKIDKVALGSLAATGLLKNFGGETGQTVSGALNALGGLLGNKPAATNAAPSPGTTNSASTNQPPQRDLLDALRKLTK